MTTGEATTHAPRRDRTGFVILAVVTAALVRLIPLQWLHPLNWDEIEFFRATSWIGMGRVPYASFWEHHTPLMWFVFAPFTRLTESPGVNAIVALRWAQIPVWIVTFWLVNVWMRGAGISRFARWAAMALAVTSSLFMIPAVEYRVDSLGCMLVMAGLVLAQRERYAIGGAAFCLAAFANLRLGPMLVVAVLALILSRRGRSWQLIAGGLVTLVLCLSYFVATNSLGALVQQVWTDNLAEKYAKPVVGGFFHRLLVPFGIRIIASDRLFDLAAVDVGGIAVLVLAFIGIVLTASRWRGRSDLIVLVAVLLANVAFTASMKFIYNYHLLLVVVLALPFVALAIERDTRRTLVVVILVLAWCVNVFASVFRGKELDRAYQDLVMREVHARTQPGDEVWSGVPWALRREPAYRFWFMPELARQLVRTGQAEKYVVRRPPAAVVFDHNVLLWLVYVQRELAGFFIRHYMPVWRELWVPGMNVRLEPGRSFEFVVPRAGDYRIYASPSLARHPWFRDPLLVATYKRADASRLTVTLPQPGSPPSLLWTLDGTAFTPGPVISLREGQHLQVESRSTEPLAVVVLSSADRQLFRQPPPGATLEGEATRVTHVPQLGVSIPR